MLRADDKIGPYRLIMPLGSGAFGVVWLAQEEKLIREREVALKLPNDPDPDLNEIRREARIWEALGTHPNVVPVYDADVYAGQVAIASEYISGGTLTKWMNAHGGKAPTVEKAIEITLGILAGLEHLHANRLIHRDLKPGNILIQNDTPRLTDFGISRVLSTSMHTTNASGTPAYMSPEMYRGHYSEQSDLWAVGVILYRLLCGSLPFPQQQQVELMYAVVHDPPQPLPPTLPNELRQIVMRTLEKEPAARGSTAQMRQELERFLALLRSPLPPLPGVKPPSGTTVPILPGNSGTSQFQVPLQHSSILTPAPRPVALSRAPVPAVNTPAPVNASSNPAVTRRAALIIVGIGMCAAGGWGFWKLQMGWPPETNPKDGAEMILIPAGEFTMGSPQAEIDALVKQYNGDYFKAEGPQHKVSLDGYYIYRTPVTVGQYLKFCDETGHKKPEAPTFNPNWAHTDHPIVNVSWDDGEAYCKWASGDKPGSVHLPTEAQWEKAARGPNGYKYPWGNKWDGSKCANSVSPDKQTGTVKVGSYPANGYGLYDMAGNVWEWCSDWYDEGFYSSSRATVRNPENQLEGAKEFRVLRGGSWHNNDADYFRCADRSRPDLRVGVEGFRCAVRAD